MQLLAVAACVRILATAVSGLPFDGVRMKGPLRTTLEPPPSIVTDPFGGQDTQGFPTRRQGFGQLMVSLLLRGNGYALVAGGDLDGGRHLCRRHAAGGDGLCGAGRDCRQTGLGGFSA